MQFYYFQSVDDIELQYVVVADDKEEATTKLANHIGNRYQYNDYSGIEDEVREGYEVKEFTIDNVIRLNYQSDDGDVFRFEGNN